MREEDALKLDEFVEASKAKGASDEFLAAFPTRRGWPVDDVYAALGRYWERATGLSVPDRSGAGESSRDAFFYLLSFSTLATWATALGSMLFQCIDHWFPDTVSGPPLDLRQSVTWQMASVAVAFPIYLLVMRIIVREVHEHHGRAPQDCLRREGLARSGGACKFDCRHAAYFGGHSSERRVIRIADCGPRNQRTLSVSCEFRHDLRVVREFCGEWAARSVSRTRFPVLASRPRETLFLIRCFGARALVAPLPFHHSPRRRQNRNVLSMAIKAWPALLFKLSNTYRPHDFEGVGFASTVSVWRSGTSGDALHGSAFGIQQRFRAAGRTVFHQRLHVSLTC